MNLSLEDLVVIAGTELASEQQALDALDQVEGLDAVPPPSTIESHLPEKGTTIGLHALLSRALRDAGKPEEADAILLAVAERLNQAGYWKGLARVVSPALDRIPQQAAPLIARARTQGGPEAVNDELLEAAHRSLPRHGLLSWLAAEAQLERGETATARRTAAAALPELLAEKNYDTADMALLLLAEEESPATHAAICRSLELLARQEAWSQFESVLSLANDLLADEEYASRSWPVIRELWRRHPEQEALRPIAVAVARTHFASYPEPEAMVRISEIERPSQEVSIILERIRVAERFPPGYYASHSGWGIGRIRDNTVEALIIDFPTKPLHRMSMATAEQALDAFPPEDLRVLLRYNQDEVARLARDEPATLLAKTLLCLPHGKGTTDEIRKILVPGVMPTGSWTNWWKGAQEAASRDPRIDTRQAYNNIFALAGDSEPGEDVHLPVWDPQKSAAKNITLLDTFITQHPEESGRLLEEMEERILTVYRDHARIPQAAAMAGLLLLRIDPERPEHPGRFIAATFDMNSLNKRDQEQLLGRLDASPGLISALNSRLVGVRRQAWERLQGREDVVQAVDQVLAGARSYPEAALHILEMAEGRVSLGRSPERSRSLLIAVLDLLEDPPRESHRKRTLVLLDPQSPLGEDLSRFPIPEDDRTGVTSRLRLWRSSDRFRFPVLDFLRSVGHQGIAEDVEGARARSAARLSERVAAVEDPYAGVTLFTRHTFTRLQEERQRVGMELKTTIPQAIQKARELGDLRENAEYDAAKAKQASYAKRFEELETLLDGVRLIEDLEREDGVALPGTEVELEDESGSLSTIWLLGEGDQDVGEQVVSYLAAVGKAVLGRRVGEEVSLPRDGDEAGYRIRRVTERLP